MGKSVYDQIDSKDNSVLLCPIIIGNCQLCAARFKKLARTEVCGSRLITATRTETVQICTIDETQIKTYSVT